MNSSANLPLAGAASPFKRTRTGCLTCRQRKRKCDGRRPTCGGCEARSQVCRWGLKVSFHSSRSLRLSQSDSDALSFVERQRFSPGAQSLLDSAPHDQFIHDTEEVILSYRHTDVDNNSDNTDVDSTSDTQTQPLTPKPSKEVGNLGNSSSVTEYPCIPGDETTGIISGAGDNSGATEQNDRPANLYALPLDPLLVGIDTDGIGHVSFSMTSPDVPFFLGQAISQRTSPLPDPQFPVSHSTKTRLLAAYLQEAASWCETTDSDASFTVGSVHSMMESSPFVAAAIALASHQQDSVRGRNRPLTLELYQFAVRLLLRRDSIQTDAHILTTYVSLCVYEMMASDVSEWRRHLKGCAGLLRSHAWSGSSVGIVKTCFWAFARIDVWAAFITGQSTLIPTVSWVHDECLQRAAAKESIDDYCNLAILLFAKVVNLLNAESRTTLTRGHTIYDSLKKAWDSLQDWWSLRPKKVCPVLANESPEGSQECFPTIIYAQSSANCGNTFYHVGCILLLRSGYLGSVPDAIGEGNEEFDQVRHARALLGIAVCNPSHANWVNQLQPLYIAGLVFGDSSQAELHPVCQRWGMCASGQVPLQQRKAPPNTEDHECNSMASIDDVLRDGRSGNDYAGEKLALLKHLATIQRATGCKTSDRAREPRVLWELEV